jgi:hypothetical protein
MARKSSIKKRLTSDELEQLHAWLNDPKLTQLETTEKINELIEDRGGDPVTKSAVNRYKLNIDEVGASMREAREMAEIWIGKLGSAPQSQVANMTSELIRTALIDLSLALKKMTLGETDPDVVFGAIKMAKDLAFAHEKLEKAVSETTDREVKIKEIARKEALAEAASNAETAARAQGMDEDQVAFWRNKVLGI